MPERSLEISLRDPNFYLVDLDFKHKMMAFAYSRPTDFTKSSQITAQSFPLSRFRFVSFTEVFNELTEEKPNQGSLSYIFHLPFSGSTLLSKCLELWSPVLRDPAFLHSLYLPRLAAPKFPDEIERLRSTALQLLSRRFKDRKTIVRTGGYWPVIIRPLVLSSTFHSAIFLYIKPNQYLAQVLKSPSRRKDMRELLAKKKNYVRQKTGLTIKCLTDADVALLFWALSVENILKNAEEGKEIRMLDYDTFLKNPSYYLTHICALLDISADQTRQSAKLAKILARHSKGGETFDYQDRNREIAKLVSIYRDEIASALANAEHWNISTRELLFRLRRRHI